MLLLYVDYGLSGVVFTAKSNIGVCVGGTIIFYFTVYALETIDTTSSPLMPISENVRIA